MATKLRDRGNLSSAQQNQIRDLLTAGKSHEEVAKEMHYLPKYLAGRIAFHGLDGAAPAATAAKPKAAKAKPKAMPMAKATAAQSSPRDVFDALIKDAKRNAKLELIDFIMSQLEVEKREINGN